MVGVTRSKLVFDIPVQISFKKPTILGNKKSFDFVKKQVHIQVPIFLGGGVIDFVRPAFFLGAVDLVKNRYVGMDVKSAALVRVGSLILCKFEGGGVVQ